MFNIDNYTQKFSQKINISKSMSTMKNSMSEWRRFKIWGSNLIQLNVLTLKAKNHLI